MARKSTAYKIKNNSIENFKQLGFSHCGDGIYYKDFPCYKWNGFVTIKGRFIGNDETKDILIDVIQEDGRLYAPYYSNEDSKVVAIIRSNIRRECEKCNIKRITNINNEK